MGYSSDSVEFEIVDSVTDCKSNGKTVDYDEDVERVLSECEESVSMFVFL